MVRPLADVAAFFSAWFDVGLLQGFLNGLGKGFLSVSAVTSFRLSGNLQRHAIVMLAGVVLLLVYFM